MERFAVLILAGGRGKRFKSALPKVLHTILGKPMLWYVLRSAVRASPERVAVVAGYRAKLVESFVRSEFPGVELAYQDEPLGTGHAVACARRLFEGYRGRLVVLNGDMPLICPEDITALAFAGGDMALLTAVAENPTGYGRVVRRDNVVVKVVEEKDADEEERRIKEVNTGLYSFDPAKLFEALTAVRNDNAQGEYYLTDVVEVFTARGWQVTAVRAEDFTSLSGVNDRCELSRAEAVMRARIVEFHQRSGVTVHNPECAYIEPEVEIGEDSQLFAPLFLTGRTRLGRNCTVGPFTVVKDSVLEDGAVVESHCWIDGAVLKSGARAGPFAKLRKGTVLEEGAVVGTFVETKNTRMGKGSKANHLSYLGDCDVGEGTNVGAGTITCNFDGFSKWKTEIGKEVFVGSNTLFVAPVKVGDRSITGAGSVITSDVPENTLAIARARQVNYEGKADAVRQKARRRKDEHSEENS